MSNKAKIDKIADEVVKLLSPYFIVQRYNAYTSNSVYLKLDYGVGNSIRISDHPGKKHLQYRYNIIINGKDNIIEQDYIRYYYSDKTYKNCIESIILDKKIKIDKYGVKNYGIYMKQNRDKHYADKRGFWHHAKIVSGKEDEMND